MSFAAHLAGSVESGLERTWRVYLPMIGDMARRACWVFFTSLYPGLLSLVCPWQLLWIFSECLEPFAIVPQLIVLQRYREVENLTGGNYPYSRFPTRRCTILDKGDILREAVGVRGLESHAVGFGGCAGRGLLVTRRRRAFFIPSMEERSHKQTHPP